MSDTEKPMKTKAINKSKWPPGPWHTEPDRDAAYVRSEVERLAEQLAAQSR